MSHPSYPSSLVMSESSGNGDFSMDIVMEDESHQRKRRQPEKHFTIAIDFGTTFSSVAFIALPPSEKSRRIEPGHVETVDEYPGAPADNYDSRKEVPTEMLYPAHGNRRQTEESVETDSNEGETSEEEANEGFPTTMSSDSGSEAEGMEEDSLENVEDVVWGYGVQDLLRYPDQDCDLSRHLARFKLILDTSPETATIRHELAQRLNALKARGLIAHPTDAIADYLQLLLEHAKTRIIAMDNDFHEDSPVEFVLCVPAIWTGKACRTMQTAMATAIVKSNLVKLPNGVLDNLFIVSEPEAAAACVLALSNDIDPAETFVLLDAGGGTVDAITYSVRETYPLRLKAEEVKPGGALCGSSYLNERFDAILIRRLKDENYLEKNGRTIRRLVDAEVIKFENQTKRTFDVYKPQTRDTSIYIQDLRKNVSKGFQANRLLLTQKDIEEIFQPSLDGVANVMLEQIRLAKDKGLDPKKVLLIGGFAGSRSLRTHLERVLAANREPHAPPTELIIPKSLPEMAVARGAVIRALRKEDGPDRIIQSSYGFRQHDPYDPKNTPEHKGVRRSRDKLDGYLYVTNTIKWLIIKDTEVPSGKPYSIPVSHTFGVNETQFLCPETLYVSDEIGESHYKLSHRKNRGAEVAGRIVVDMTFLKTEGRIPLSAPGIRGQGRVHYRVNFQLVMIVDGRNLRYEARWPDKTGEVKEGAQICIAAAFVPGTA